MKHLFVIFVLHLIFASSVVWGVDFNCPGGRWYYVKTIQNNASCGLPGGSTCYICVQYAGIAFSCTEYQDERKYVHWGEAVNLAGWNSPTFANCRSTLCSTNSSSYPYFLWSHTGVYEWRCPEQCDVSVSVSPTEVWSQNAGSSQTTSTIAISLTKSAPPEGCTINFTVEPVENSGGHSHTGGRPKGTVSPDSIPFASNEGWGPKYATYTSSEVSGEEKIKIKVNGKNAGEEKITVRVPSLIQLGDGENHDLKTPTRSHPSSYWGAMDVIGYFITIANEYAVTFPNDERLVVTDMSLPQGGMFDLCGTYNPQDTCSNAPKGGHSRHRTGRNIDVRKWNIPAKNVKEFRKICRYYNASPGDHGDHYHLTFK